MDELIRYLKDEIEKIKEIIDDPMEDPYYYYRYGRMDTLGQILSKLDDINKEEEE